MWAPARIGGNPAESGDERRAGVEGTMLFKKNSILDRPIKPPSMRNHESGPDEFEAKLRRDALVKERINTHQDLDGYASRHGWTDPGHLSTTMYDNMHRLHTVITERGVEKVYNADVDTPSGTAKGARAVGPGGKLQSRRPTAGDCAADVARRGAKLLSRRLVLPRERYPQTVTARQALLRPGERSDRRQHPAQAGAASQRSGRELQPHPAPLERGALGPVEVDHEAMPAGLRSKHNMYHP